MDVETPSGAWMAAASSIPDKTVRKGNVKLDKYYACCNMKASGCLTGCDSTPRPFTRVHARGEILKRLPDSFKKSLRALFVFQNLPFGNFGFFP